MPDPVGCEAIPFRAWVRTGIKKQSPHVYYIRRCLWIQESGALKDGLEEGLRKWTSMS